MGLPEDKWGLRPCGNFDCSQLDGPCEMTVKTLVCEGGCGARYCCQGCQEQAWRAGHWYNCEAMATIVRRQAGRSEVGMDGVEDEAVGRHPTSVG